jgi:hypothetical protein
MSQSASGVSADWDIAPLLLNVSIDTPYVGVIEEQKQKNNTFRNNWLSSIASNI